MHRLSGKGRTPLSPGALSAAEFAICADRLSLFPETYTFAIAVSGGPDSMALAVCAKSWAQDKGFNLCAFIVDHAIRAESASEAATTAKRLEAIGIPAEVLIWKHDPVVTRLHITARKARYRLLIDACRAKGIDDLWLAHQMEDQAETVIMRLAKGSGIDGIAGMGAIGAMDGVRLIRPLLNVPKARLIATCTAARVSFIEDSSNASEKFARGRIRRVLPLLAEEGLTLERLTDLAARAQAAKDALDHVTQAFLARAAQRDLAGTIKIDLGELRLVPGEIASRALSSALEDIFPDDYAPEYASLIDLRDALLGANDISTRTLHGSIISRTPTHVTIQREVAHIKDSPQLNAGESTLWDKRWHVSLSKDAPSGLTIRPLGSPSHETLDLLSPQLRKSIPQGRARAALPAFWKGDKLLFIASLTGEGVASARLVTGWPKG